MLEILISDDGSSAYVFDNTSRRLLASVKAIAYAPTIEYSLDTAGRGAIAELLDYFESNHNLALGTAVASLDCIEGLAWTLEATCLT